MPLSTLGCPTGAVGVASSRQADRSGRWHAETEAAIANSGIAYTFLRPPFFLQNLLPFATIIAERGVLPSRMDPATMIAMVDSRDVAAVAAQCLVDARHRGCIYEVTGPEALTYGDVARRLAALLGRNVERVRVPEHVGRANLLQELPEWHADLWLEFDRAFEAGLGAKFTSCGTRPDLSLQEPLLHVLRKRDGLARLGVEPDPVMGEGRDRPPVRRGNHVERLVKAALAHLERAHPDAGALVPAQWRAIAGLGGALNGDNVVRLGDAAVLFEGGVGQLRQR